MIPVEEEEDAWWEEFKKPGDTIYQIPAGYTMSSDTQIKTLTYNVPAILSAHTQRMIQNVEEMKRDYNLDALDAVIEMLKKE